VLRGAVEDVLSGAADVVGAVELVVDTSVVDTSVVDGTVVGSVGSGGFVTGGAIVVESAASSSPEHAPRTRSAEMIAPTPRHGPTAYP